MAGTKIGGLKAAAKNLEKNPNFYREIGMIGGRLGHTGGFAGNPELARIAGAKGGAISRRRRVGETDEEYAIRKANNGK
jgi:hypothetical protein